MIEIRPATQLVLRLVLGIALVVEAIHQSTIFVIRADSGMMPAMPGIAFAVLHALMLVAAIWVLFGIRTRIVALIGLACLYADSLIIPLVPGFPERKVLFAVAILAAVPLIFFGGGRFSLYRAGWRNPF